MGQPDNMLQQQHALLASVDPVYTTRTTLICCAMVFAVVPAAAAADMPDMFSGGFNPAMLSQMDPASLAQLQKMAAQVRR
jgi:hypothetical protein